MTEPLRASIAQIKFNDAVAGVGFIITANGIIVTCAHVVLAAHQKPGGRIDVYFPQSDSIHNAEILEEGWREAKEEDLAFLKIREQLPGNLVPVLLGLSEGVAGHQFLSLGFPILRDESGEPFGSLYAEGHIVQKYTRKNKRVAIQLTSFELDLGYSGAPVLDKTANTVIGIVTDVRKTDPFRKQQYTAWATPSENIVEACPQPTLLHAGKEIGLGKLPPRFEHRLEAAQYFRGRSSQLSTLKAFWRRSKPGVLALVGIGGSGKTAIVRQFLRLQHWLDSDDVPEQPDALFVWSFYDKADTTLFLTKAYSYFSGLLEEADRNRFSLDGQNANPSLLAEILERINSRVLIVMDGLEKMQSDGGRFGLARGRLIDPPLRDLLLRIAEGLCGQTKSILTSRFPLTDLADLPKDQYDEINIDKLEPDSARSLLRKLGVRGSSGAIDSLGADYGLHALTIDLLGRLLVEYYNGDPLAAKSLPALETATGTPAVDKQADKLARVLRAYENRIDPVQLTTLEYLSVFRRPVEFSFLVDVFLKQKSPSLSTTISNLTQEQLRSILHVLATLRLVILEKDAEGKDWFTAHPAIRDHFYIRFTDPKGIHDAIRSRLATLVDAPGYIKPKDPAAVDTIEELVYHTVQTDRTEEAYKIYGERLGYRHLGWGLGDHVRGAGIARLFETKDGQRIGDIDQSKWDLLTIDHGLYLKNMGLLDEAMLFFERAATEEKQLGSNLQNLASALQNLSAVQVLRGRLPDAEVSARSALEYAITSADDRLIQDCRVRVATALALQGHADEAEAAFQAVRSFLTKERKKTFPRDFPGIRLSWLLMRLGRLTEADTVLKETRELSEHFAFPIITARADVLIGELAYLMGNKDAARKALDRVFSWASRAYDQEMTVAGSLVSAWLALGDSDLHRAKRFVRDGLRVAEECGHSCYWIDLKIAQGRISLVETDLENVNACIEQALLGKTQQIGRPRLLGARSDECRYNWGVAAALQLLGEANLSNGNEEEAIRNLLEARRIRTQLHDCRLVETATLLKKLGKDSD